MCEFVCVFAVIRKVSDGFDSVVHLFLTKPYRREIIPTFFRNYGLFQEGFRKC